MSDAMKAAGLTAPVPGLDALNGQGQFFACEPYGTCWEPTNGWAGKPANVAEVRPATAVLRHRGAHSSRETSVVQRARRRPQSGQAVRCGHLHGKPSWRDPSH